MREFNRAYSLVELILVVLFIGIFAAIAIPRINFGIISKQKVDTVAKKIVTDMRRARRLAITDAANNTIGYAVTFSGVPTYDVYRIRNRDTATVVDIYDIPSDIDCTGGSIFRFGPLGNLVDSSDTTLRVAGDGRSFTIDIISATGTVKCTED